jgi:hypothetical protein
MVIAKIKWRYKGYEVKIFKSLKDLGNYIAKHEDIEEFKVVIKR